MNSAKRLFVATALTGLLAGAGTLQAADTSALKTMKPMQGVSFHTETKDAVAYFTADKGTCKVVLTLTDKTAYAPTRFEDVVEPRKSTLYQVDDGKALEFACQADAQAMSVKEMDQVGVCDAAHPRG